MVQVELCTLLITLDKSAFSLWFMSHSPTLIYIKYVFASSSTFLPEVFKLRTDK